MNFDSVSYELHVANVAETDAFGFRLGQSLLGGEVLALIGTLGAGKTHLTKGIARGAGFHESRNVTSPTFVLVNEYPGRVHICHIDAYRLKGPDDLATIAFDDMLDGHRVLIIEWADRVLPRLPQDRLEIRMEITGPTSRKIQYQPQGQSSAALQARFAAGTTPPGNHDTDP